MKHYRIIYWISLAVMPVLWGGVWLVNATFDGGSVPVAATADLAEAVDCQPAEESDWKSVLDMVDLQAATDGPTLSAADTDADMIELGFSSSPPYGEGVPAGSGGVSSQLVSAGGRVSSQLTTPTLSTATTSFEPVGNEVNTGQSFDINSLECNAFAVEYSDGKFEVFSRPDNTIPNIWKINNSAVDATVSKNGGQLWQLELTPQKTVQKVWFPWWPKTLVESRYASDYVLYYPYLMGTVSKCDYRKPFAWWGVEYPGTAFAPLMVISNDQQALMVAAANWPPKKTKVYYSFMRMSMLYEEEIVPGNTSTFRAITCKSSGDPSHGIYAWHTVVDEYKMWLKAKMEIADLLPIDYPKWMREIDGFMNVQLQNMPQFNIAEVYKSWNQWRSVFPWVQFWGQMSDYAGKQGAGCCLEKQEMHPRYKPELFQFVQSVTGGANPMGHVGFYTKPKGSSPIVSNTSAFNYVLDWIQKNKNEYEANAFYIDVLGNMYHGEPLAVAALFRDVFPKDIFIEYPVDIYPTAFLVSGSLGGSQYAAGSWPQYPQELSNRKKTAAFPAFGRYLLDDRIIFLGESNGDHTFFGSKKKYWAERQAFLLGAKFDVTSYTLRFPKETTALELAIAERKRVSWWQRQPVYRDVKEISDIPEGIQVRRFKGKDDRDLLAIDNWNLIPNQNYKFKNQTISVPVKQLSITVH